MSTPLVCRICDRPLPEPGLATCPHCGQTLAATGGAGASGGAGGLPWMELDATPSAAPSGPRPPLPIPNVPNIPTFPSAPAASPDNPPQLRPVEVPVDDFEEKLARIDRRRSAMDRRPGARRRRRVPEPRRRNWSWLIAVAAIVVIVSAGIYAVVATRSARPRFDHRFHPHAFEPVPIEIGDLPPEEQEDLEQDPFAPIRRGLGVVDPPVQAAIRRMFDELGNSIRLGDETSVAHKISGTRFVEELLALASLHRGNVVNFDASARSAERVIAETLVRNADDWRWTEFEAKRFVPIDAETVKVLARHKTARGSRIATWWLARRRDGWRVFDYENCWDVRGTILHADVLNVMQLSVAPTEESGTLRTLREAHEILIADQTAPTATRADGVLRRVPAERLPSSLAAAYRWMRSEILQRQGKFAEALAENEKCRQADPSRPVLDLWDAMLLYDSVRDSDALARVERFHRNVGSLAESQRELGNILFALGRRPEARNAFRKALDDRPDDADNFLLFLTSIDAFRKEEDVGHRFMQLARPAKDYERFAANRKNAGDFESLRQLAIEMCKIDWKSPLPREHLALVAARLEAPEQALQSFKNAMEMETAPEHRATAATEFLREMANSGHALAAYKELSAAPAEVIEPGLLFLGLAESARFRQPLLRRLVRLHGERHGDDPHVQMFRAEILADDGKDAAADAAFAAAAARLRDRREDVAFVESFLYSRLAVRSRLGKALESLDDFEPRTKVLANLTAIAIQEKKYDLLDAIIDRSLKDDPKNLDMLRRRMENRIRQGKTKEGIALYRELIDLERKAGAQADRLTDNQFLMAMVDRNQVLEAYHAARDPKEAFLFLSRDLESMGRPGDFDKLLDAYAADHPGDPMVPLARARHLARSRQYVRAIEQFDLAAKGKFDPKSFVDPVRESIYARYKAGQALAAYRDLEGREKTFAQLAVLAIGDRDSELLEKLIAEHRKRLPDDPALEEATARLLVFEKKPAEAAVLFWKIAEKQKTPAPNRTTWIVAFDPWQSFFADMAATDQALEAYDEAPDKKMAFETLARILENDKKGELLAKLVARHGRAPAPSPRLAHHLGVAHFLEGDFAAAEKALRRALAGAKRYDRNETRMYLFRAGIEQGKTVALLREFAGADPETFRELANQCVQQKRGDQLRRLIEAEKSDPESEPRQLDAAHVDVCWLLSDYEGVLRALEEHAPSFERPDLSWRRSYRVRALVKLGRFDEAEKAAESLSYPQAMPLLKILVVAARGDVDRTIELVETHARSDYDIQDCYRHDDLGPLLRGDRFARFRERFPERNTPIGEDFDD